MCIFIDLLFCSKAKSVLFLLSFYPLYQIIDYVTAYKPLLTAVKAEYEDCIDTILRGQKEAFFLSGKLKAMASEPSTIRNYRKRSDQLEQR